MKTAVVTGATSMLGIATTKHLIENGINVIAISRANSNRLDALPKSELVTFIGCNLEDLSKLECEGIKADTFYHFAWGFTNRDSAEKYDLSVQNKNVDYTMDAIDLAKRLGCVRFVGAGSQAEYGYKDYQIDESTDCNPEIAYGQAKLKAYEQGRKKCRAYGMGFIWTRTFSVYGTNDGNTMVNYALDSFLNKEVAHFSSGIQSWNFLFEEDAGEYFFRLGFYDETHFSEQLKDGERVDCVINVGNIESKQLKRYFEEMYRAFGDEFHYDLKSPDNGKAPGGICPNVTRLIEVTDYYPMYSFERGMEIMKENAEKMCK